MTEYKDYKIERDPAYTLYYIKPKGRGSVSKNLSGGYTSLKDAQIAINSHLSLKEKEKPNGKKADTTGS